MSLLDYPDAVLKYVEAQQWSANLTQLRDGAYMIAGSKKAVSGSKTMLLLVVCEPERQVTADHIKYLLKAGREKDVNSVLLTHTVEITEKAEKLGGEYGVGVINAKKVRSQNETNDFEVDTKDISIPDSTSESQADTPKNIENWAERIVEQAKGSSITKELLLGQKTDSKETEQILADKSLIEYLNENESVDYIFWSDYKPFSLPDQDLDPGSDYRAICTISDERVLLVVGTDDGDQVISIPFDAINGVEKSTGFLKHRLTITINDSENVDVYISLESIESVEEVEKARQLIEERQTAGNGSVTRKLSSYSNESNNEDENSIIKSFITSASVFIGVFLIGFLLFEMSSLLIGTAEDPEIINQHAGELVLTIDDLDRDGWQEHDFGSLEGFEAASNSSRSSFVNTEVAFAQAAAVDSEVYVFETIEDAEESYEDYVDDIEYKTEQHDAAEQTVMYNPSGTDLTVAVFQDRNTIGIISYQQSGFDAERQVTLGGLIGDVRSNYGSSSDAEANMDATDVPEPDTLQGQPIVYDEETYNIHGSVYTAPDYLDTGPQTATIDGEDIELYLVNRLEFSIAIDKPFREDSEIPNHHYPSGPNFDGDTLELKTQTETPREDMDNEIDFVVTVIMETLDDYQIPYNFELQIRDGNGETYSGSIESEVSQNYLNGEINSGEIKSDLKNQMQ